MSKSILVFEEANHPIHLRSLFALSGPGRFDGSAGNLEHSHLLESRVEQLIDENRLPDTNIDDSARLFASSLEDQVQRLFRLRLLPTDLGLFVW